MKDKIKQWFIKENPELESNDSFINSSTETVYKCFKDLGLSNEWVSVDDRLPKPNQKVLTASKDGRVFYTMFLQGQVKHSFSCILSVYDHDNVTHWQNLPLPPSEVKSWNIKI